MELSVGQRATRSKTVTADDVKTFAELTGDRNPLHFDESFAAKTRFGRLVVQGGLTTGLLHALVDLQFDTCGLAVLARELRHRPAPGGDRLAECHLHRLQPACRDIPGRWADLGDRQGVQVLLLP